MNFIIGGYYLIQGAKAQNSKATAGAQAEDIQAAYNTYLKAQAAYELAEKTYQRVNNLYKEGVMPAQKRDEAETNMKASLETANAAKAIWEKAKNGTRIEDKEAASAMVARAEGAIDEVVSYLKETNIYAPIDGEIANIVAESGELVSAGYPVVTNADGVCSLEIQVIIVVKAFHPPGELISCTVDETGPNPRGYSSGQGIRESGRDVYGTVKALNHFTSQIKPCIAAERFCRCQGAHGQNHNNGQHYPSHHFLLRYS